jgi:hypothetical protein
MFPVYATDTMVGTKLFIVFYLCANVDKNSNVKILCVKLTAIEWQTQEF